MNSDESVEKAVKSMLEKTEGRCDVLINNAGFSLAGGVFFSFLFFSFLLFFFQFSSFFLIFSHLYSPFSPSPPPPTRLKCYPWIKFKDNSKPMFLE